MDLSFFGAVREVTGSMHMIDTGHDRILLDCGLFQGRRKETWEKNTSMPINPATITNVVLSHAHIDHSGRIPLLVKEDFKGQVVTTRATQDVCNFLLPDSAHIQESDADYLNYKNARSALATHGKKGVADDLSNREAQQVRKLLKSGRNKLNRAAISEIADRHNLTRVEPLYREADARFSLGFFSGNPYRTPITIGKDMTCTFYEAGHILGSAISIIHYGQGKDRRTVCYTGDLGRFDMPILKNPCLDFREEDREIDLLIMESTYGDRVHESSQDLNARMAQELNLAIQRKGSVVIPAFALGRTQQILYVIHELYEQGVVPRIPVYVDSPLASGLTKVFVEHPELYDQETHKTFLEHKLNPFCFDGVDFVSSVDESMDLMRKPEPCIVISAAGMCEAGRILHHLRYRIHNPVNTILIVGFMAENTLGRRILDLGKAYRDGGGKGEAPVVKILGKEYPLKANVVPLNGFSAHADREEMMRFLKTSNLKVKKIAVVHGEEQASLKFADRLGQEGFKAVVPKAGQKIEV
ncbi:beta-lactamase-like:RNA-metabolising metallo-beta-lactamase [Desulforapulum autotrophicum HRM2]|uniref:Beta-lactamase-like:RNA-metabolising metallo-beta-lactamase n=1 Tax=Desulforapulum autotrophicum (strain ATCC 43914 / DSM 3382 / VKM B-1955 / HRM2) TaxID=177437 RepID=C0QD54_DESAH|nr:MBL fold metallo-hydrolase [Desulforapulum autotrophicum]ACN17286.1 beta-lactamase-like:RNA-metabolising metallo-beta-lactamase [Desulforapulum autotrophicum HRM2]